MVRGIPAQDRIYVAGEKEHEQQKLVSERGIPINRNLRRDLQTLRDELASRATKPISSGAPQGVLGQTDQSVQL